MKRYVTPSITAAGSVRALTAQGGGTDESDVPLGTPANGDLANITGFVGS